MTYLHLLSHHERRTRITQDTIAAVALAYATLALYLAPHTWDWASLVPALFCLYFLIDLARVLSVRYSRRGVATWWVR